MSKTVFVLMACSVFLRASFITSFCSSWLKIQVGKNIECDERNISINTFFVSSIGINNFSAQRRTS